MDSYLVKPRIYMDREGLTEILQGRKKAFIVTDRFMHESGKVSYITDICARMGVEVTIFSEIKPDPDIATVTKGISMMVDIKPDVLFALGGGSSIDAAKAMNYLASREGMLEKAYFVAIPTTSGTGSEVTTFAVISDPDKKAKYPLISENMLPDAAVLDAELTKTVPASITADTGIDVLTHAYEAYVSSKANDFTDAAAEKSMKLVFEYLPEAYKAAGKNIEELTKEDLYARQKMHHASCLAGMAFSNAGLGINHSMAHTLGGHFHIPHGRANALVLPYVIEFNADMAREGAKHSNDAAKKYQKMARIVGLPAPTPKVGVANLIAEIQRLLKYMDRPQCMSECGVSVEEFNKHREEIVRRALADACTQANPRKVTAEDINKILDHIAK